MVYMFGFCLLAGLAILSWIDLKTYKLPDVLNLGLAGLGVLQNWVLTGSIAASLLGIAIGYAALVALEIGFKKLRHKDGIGRGDAKLLAVGGAWCGAAGLPFIVLVASLTGLIAVFVTNMGRQNELGWIPFGPFLALGIMTVWVWGQAGLMG